MVADVDTANLPAEVAATFEGLLADVDLDALAAASPRSSAEAPSAGADRFRYELTVWRGGRCHDHDLSMAEADVTPGLRPLMACLMQLASPGD